MSEQKSLITDEVKASIGRTVKGEPELVEMGMIREFAIAIAWPDPPNPLYTDEAYARKTRHKGVIAPPTFFTRLGHNMPRPHVPLPECKVQINGGHEFEMLGTIRLGDRITMTRKVADVYEKLGRKDHMVFVIYDFAYTNHLNEVVGKGKFTAIRLY